MAQTGFTPISNYYSATATNVPTAGNLVAGELAINTADGKLFYKDSSGVVQTIATKASAALGGSTTGTGATVLQTSPTITTPVIDKITTSVANTSLGAGNASIMKNRIINGAMVINQRALGTVTINTSGTYTIDRWQANQTAAGKFTVQQSSTAPVGFQNSYLATSTSAYSVSSSDIFFFQQNIEGYNIADLSWGTANAKTVTLSAWVQSSLTGTFGGAIANATQDYCYPFTFSIPVANTWTQVSITITGATAGTWNITNGLGMQVIFGLGGGSGRSATAGTWTTSGVYTATGAVSVVGTNGATFYITGVQLEVGSSATGFEYRQYGTELALCQRYYETNSSPSANGGYYASASAFSTTQCRFGIVYQVPKRAQPSITFAAGSTFNLQALGANTQPSSFATVCINPNNFYAYATGTYTLSVPYMLIDSVSTSFINISAEL